MKTATRILSAALVTVLGTGVASAQEPAPAPAQADVSQINGQLVPVGTHNEYRYDFKRWNVSTNPLGLMVGSYGASVSYGVTQNLAVRADVNYFDEVDGDGTGYELGVGAPIYLRRTYQGPFVEPGVIVRGAEDEGVEFTTFGPQMLLGWHWTWDSGLNVAIALGVGRNFSTSDSDETELDDAAIFGNGYLRLGYAF